MKSSLTGKTERRLALVILLSALIPLTVSIALGTSLFRQTVSVWFNRDVGTQLDRGIDVYKDYVRAVKEDLHHQLDAITFRSALREMTRSGKSPDADVEIDALFSDFPHLVSIQITDNAGSMIASRSRKLPIDPHREKSLEIHRPLSGAGPALNVTATFAVDRKRFDELEAAGDVVNSFHKLESSRDELVSASRLAFMVLIALTLTFTVPLGVLLARGVTRRVRRLSSAIERVAAGDFGARVPVTGADELTELARAFNRMVDEMERARARIEYLQRMGAWQEMAQRLAHEIKNPLTPIQLAVQQCHRKYDGDSRSFRTLLDTTLEIVEEEVGTLRRLVGTFSDFARMPHAEPIRDDITEFLRECRDQFSHLEDALPPQSRVDSSSAIFDVDIDWKIPNGPIFVAMDRQMLRRVILNLIRNAVQAIRENNEHQGQIRIAVRVTDTSCTLDVEDSGPGLLHVDRKRIFDPYVTTKSDGSGLGLAIAKKIVVELGGEIEALDSADLGGAKFAIHIPRV